MKKSLLVYMLIHGMTNRGLISDTYIDRLDYEDSASRWLKIINKNEEIILVVENAIGEIIGYAYGGKNRDENSLCESELFGIYILKDYQKQHIGKELFKVFISNIKTKSPYYDCLGIKRKYIVSFL